MKSNKGFTIIEVVMALVILTVVILGGFSATSGFIHEVAVGDIEAAALQLADDKIAEIRMDPNYATLDSIYPGTENNFPTMAGFTRKTVITQIGGPSSTQDHKKITVTVAGPTLANPVNRTITLAAP